jgi:nucleolar GTP-binding protein
MNFQDLIKVEKPDFYLGLAFRNAKEKANLLRTKKLLKGTRLEKSQKIELLKITVIKDSLLKNLNRILNAFPNFKGLPVFYLELVKCTLDYEQVKKSLGAVKWASQKVEDFFKIYRERITKCKGLEKINQYRREFYGRVSSLLKQITKELDVLESSRKVMKSYPSIKTSLPTVAICGFPNIGKTTLLYKLTGSKPEISNYAFTTKCINVAYLKEDNKKIQLLDTPGSLNRFNKMNNIEKQAYLAIKYCANLLVYVFDLTEPYPLQDQILLFENLKETKKPIVLYLSKKDILNKETIKRFQKNYKCISEIEELKKRIIRLSS